MNKVLTFPDLQANPTSIRAKALVFQDPASLEILSTTELIAPSQASVLILGDTGTGKELIARHIHILSGRIGPFVAVNCGTFNENLIEAELFGHEAGAFTGALGLRLGWFEAAQHGTLFLDEIGDLPQAMQVKLLRVLQERQVVRLGSCKPIDIDVRLVAATNVDLASAVEAGHFRADLYYRLNIATINLPPLRERPGDIISLAEYFLDIYRAKMHLGPIEFSSDALQALVSYGWTGNIRELENVIHYALIVCRDGVIHSGDLRINERVPVLNNSCATAAADDGDESQLSKAFKAMFDEKCESLFEQVEETVIRLAFRYCDNNQVRAARLLGISRYILRAQLQRFGMLASGKSDTRENGKGVSTTIRLADNPPATHTN